MNNVNEKIEAESKSIIADNKPWYKKKNTIIASSSILGAGVLATVIAVPIALTNNASSNATVPIETVRETIALLNKEGNSSARSSILSAYIEQLTIAPSGDVNEFIKIVMGDVFIDEFISLLTDNLYIDDSATNPAIGSITTTKLDQIKITLKTQLVIESFKNINNVDYTNFLNFTNSTGLMFGLKDKTNNPTIDFSLYMPTNSTNALRPELVYNEDKTISIKIGNGYSTTATDNPRLTINKFTSPTISTSENYYFKSDAIIKLPSALMNSFPTFFDTQIRAEKSERDSIINGFTNIQKKIDSDTTKKNGLSYWNSFALNYSVNNLDAVKADLINANSSLLKFLSSNAKDSASNLLPEDKITLIQTALSASTTDGYNSTPFVASPSYSDVLFNTVHTSATNFSLSIDIKDFSYTFAIDNLFNGPNAYKVIPSLTLSGTLTEIPQSGAPIPYTFDNVKHDMSSLVNISITHGLAGFLETMVQTPTSPLATLTNGLVSFNKMHTIDQIKFWNDFNANQINNTAILNELIKTDVLYNFIMDNIDLTNNANGFGGSFPSILDTTTLKTNINAAAKSLTSANLNFVDSGDTTTNVVAAITLQNIVYGTTDTEKFENITIYFGYGILKIRNINITSVEGGPSNLSFNQDEGLTAFDNVGEVTTSAQKRVSVVFNTSSTISHVFYFGQRKVGTTQTTKPIIIPSTILTQATNFINAIQSIK